MKYRNIGMVRITGFLLVAAVLIAPQTFAKTDAVSAAFDQLRQYDDGKPTAPLYKIERAMTQITATPQARREAADRFAAMLADPKVSLAAKVFVFSQLPLVADDRQVPVLVKLLDDPKTVDLARGALEDIPGEVSAKALRDALPRLKGSALTGLINSLGIRRDAAAVPALSELLKDAAQHTAAAQALGRIGTRDAATALTAAEATPALYDARLRCAEQRLADADRQTAEVLYRDLCTPGIPVHLRVAGLTGLAKAGGEKALPVLQQAIAADNALLQATATRLCGALPGKKATAILANQLDHVKPDAQVQLLHVLADRADSTATDAVMKRIDTGTDEVKLAAVQALGALGNANSVPRLATLAATGTGAIQQAARTSLVQLAAPDIEAAIIMGAARGDPSQRCELIRALGARHSEKASPTLIKAATDPDKSIRKAALTALTETGQPQCYPELVKLLCTPADPSDGPAILQAAAAVGRRADNPSSCVSPVLAALKKAPPAARPSLVTLLASFGGADALGAVRLQLKNPDAATVDAAVRALTTWPDASAAGDLLAVAQSSGNQTHRVLALRGYFKLVKATPDTKEKQRLLKDAQKVATTPEAKRLLLSALGDAPGPETLDIASAFLNDNDVGPEAKLATKRIRQALAKAERNKTIMEKRVNDKSVVAYLDCGPDSKNGRKGGPALRLTSGQPYTWAGSGKVAHPRYGTISYGSQVVFEATGLDKKKFYTIGFSWWDFDHNDRVISVWASSSPNGYQVPLLKGTKLPSYAAGKNDPEEQILAIPRELYGDGKVTITFKLASGTNVTVSELWLDESDKESAPPASAGAPKKAAAAATEIPAPGKNDKSHVLIVTGVDLHKWRETCPVLKAKIEKDSRLEVTVTEDPHQLASERIHDYDVLVLHFMDWKVPSPGTEARENLKKFTRNGGGIVLVHFACGAWQDWPEFVEVAGRVWNPKMRGHDPRGPFTVDIKDPNHPITKGMKPFTTTDELYTCLDGKTDIHVIAEARSKVDKKMYPMAFVLNYGKGRVFHSALGHDVKAFEAPAVGELFRRGTVWAAKVD